MTTSRRVGFWMGHFWRDEALRAQPLWIVVTALNTSVATGAIVFRMARNGTTQGTAAVLLAVLWLALGIYLAAGSGRVRSSRLDLTLPLTARSLWLRHLGATVASGLVVLGASMAVVVAHESLLDVTLGWQRLAGPLVAGLVLVVVLMQSYRPELREPPRGRFNLLLAVCLVGVPLLLLALIRWPLAATVATLAVSAAIGYRTLQVLPPSLSLVAAAPVEAGAGVASHLAPGEAGGRWGTNRALFSILHHAPPWGAATPWMLYIFVLLVGFIMAGGLSWLFDDQALRVMYLPLASYSLFTGLGLLLYQSFRVDPLPVSRQRLFALLMLPTLAVFLVGFAAARLTLATRAPAQLVDYQIRGEHYWVDVPLRFLSITGVDEVPSIEAPWGESHPGWSAPLFKGSDAVLYSPFNTSEASSARFEAFLTSRAIEAVYSETIPLEEILERYFVVENDRPVGFKQGGFSLLADYPQLAPPEKGPESAVYVALVVVPWLLVTALFFGAFRAPSSERRVKRVYRTIMTLLLAVMLGQGFGMISGWYNLEGGGAVLGIAIRQLGESQVTAALAWAVAMALIAGSYYLALYQYRRAEMPATPVELSLIEFASGDS